MRGPHVGAVILAAEFKCADVLDYPPLAYTVDPSVTDAAQAAVRFPNGQSVAR